VESEPGRGATFWIAVPLPRRAARPAVPIPPGLRGRRALVVDDSAASRAVLDLHLSGLGLVVDCASDGAEALARAREAVDTGRPYAVAVLDVEMPVIDGMALARRLRHEPGLAGLPVVLLTLMTLRGDEATGCDTRVARCLVKPVREVALREAIIDALRRPEASEAVAEAREAEETGPESEAAPGAPETGPGRAGANAPLADPRAPARARVLLAEDNVVNQKVAARMLERLGYRTDVVGNGVEALEALARIDYDLVLMDCQMPEMDGFEAVKEIRRREGRRRHTPIVALTANAMEGDRDRCVGAGMDDYLAKPVDREALATVLGRWLGS
jgi:CheY-like chemotaxis protein